MALLRHPRTRSIEPPSSPSPPPDDGRSAVDAAGGPSFRGPLESILRHPLLVVGAALVFVAAGLAFALLREPVHTAEARINVGRVDVPAYTLQGVTVGNSTLAASYARAIAAPAVIKPAARAAGISEEEARDRLQASQVPGSTLIRVEAEGGSSREAQQLANAAAGELINYVTTLNVRQQESRSLDRFRRAQVRVERARTRLTELGRRRRPSAKAVERARLDLRALELAARTTANRVLQASFIPPSENLLQLVVPAATAESDEGSVLQQALLVGLVAGLVVGMALALLRTNWHLVRASVPR